MPALEAIATDGTRHPPHPGASRFRFGDWHIERADWNRPLPSADWDFWHDDYDGPEDWRAGTAANAQACVSEIEALCEEHDATP